MKHSFSKTSQLARAILKDKLKEGHTTGNRVFVEGNTVYSYGKHYPLAEVKDNTVEINSEKSTPTTEKQKRDFESVAEEEGFRVEKKDFNPKSSDLMKRQEESDKKYLKGLKSRMEKDDITDEDKSLLRAIENNLNSSGFRSQYVDNPKENKNMLMIDARTHFRRMRVNKKYRDSWEDNWQYSYEGRPHPKQKLEWYQR
jgi:hypothetical protein